MLISMERGSSKRRDKGLQLIPAPVERNRVNCSHVGFSIQEYTLSQNEFFIRVQCGKCRTVAAMFSLSAFQQHAGFIESSCGHFGCYMPDATPKRS